MKAKEAAELANNDPKITVSEVEKQIPEYSNTLHRNQWVAIFFKHLKPDLHEAFSSLRPPKKNQAA